MYVNLVFLKLFVHHNLLNSWRLIQVCYYYLHLTDCVPFHLHLRLCSVSFAAHILCSVSFTAHRLWSCFICSSQIAFCCNCSSHNYCVVFHTEPQLSLWLGKGFTSLPSPAPPPLAPRHTPHTPMLSACCLIANTHVFCMFLQYNIQYNNTLLILKKETQFHAVWY